MADIAPPAQAPAGPLRIENFSISAFKAFPGSVSFNLAGKNLLIYGENGSGKTTVYQALRDFFSFRPPQISTVYNVFREDAKENFRVAIQLNDGTPPIEWTNKQHPTRAPDRDDRIAAAALRKSCLDYRSLLDTNYLHGENRPNLFDIAVDHLLLDFPVTVEGGTVETVGDLWSRTQNAKPHKFSASQNPVNAACIEFNEAFRTALEGLDDHLTTLLLELAVAPVQIAPLTFNGVTYQHHWFIRDRLLDGQELYPEVTLHGQHVVKPQTFLNEARLSALGIAMYLAGRLACVPSGDDRLKLMVLDDILIGLDHQNRLPLLDLLNKHFLDWQVVMLTHDRVWFDMARQYYESADDWVWAEMFADGDDGKANPSIKFRNSNLVASALDEARSDLDNNRFQSAATEARRGFEWALKRFCEKKNIPVPYKMQHQDNDADALFRAFTKWVNQSGQSREPLRPLQRRLRALRSGVLNPQTHAGAPNPARNEIQKAITTITELQSATNDTRIK